MDLLYIPEKDTVFEALFGRAVIAWNAAEGEVRQLLAFLASDQGAVSGIGPMILVAEMNTRRLSETIQAYAASTFEDENEREAVHYVAVIFDNLVAYRNHYVHGIQHLHENAGCIGTYTAKSKFKVVSGDVRVEEMGTFLDKIGELFDYTLGVHAYLNGHEGGQTSLPDKPPLLPQLKKQATLLPRHQHELEPSGE